MPPRKERKAGPGHRACEILGNVDKVGLNQLEV